MTSSIRKISILSFVAIAAGILASCTNPFAKPQDFASVMVSHNQALVDAIWPEDMKIGNDGELQVNTKLDVSTLTGPQKLALNINAKTNNKDVSVALSFSGSGDLPQIGNATADGSADMVQKSGSGFVRLNSLNVTAKDNAMISGVISGYVEKLKGKWFMLDGAAAQVTASGSQVDAKEVRRILASHNLFTMKKDLGRENGYYRYEVELNKAEYLAMQKELAKATTGKDMTAEQAAELQKSLDQATFEGTMTVNDSDREYGTFNGTFSMPNEANKGTVSTGSLAYDFNESGISVSTDSVSESAKLDLKKSLTKYSGTLVFTDKKMNKSVPLDLVITKSGNNVNVTVNYKNTDTKEEVQAVVADITASFTEKKDIAIEAPKDFTPISQATAELMGGAGGSSGAVGGPSASPYGNPSASGTYPEGYPEGYPENGSNNSAE